MMKLLLFFFMSILGTCGVYGQEAFVSGVVRDDGGELPGVTVTVHGSTMGTITDINGRFLLMGLPTDESTILFSYIGYKTIEQTVKLSSGESLNLGTIVLSESIAQLDEVVVSATYIPSQMRAYNMQKQAPNIQNVIASDGIGKLPDRNAAEAVQRIPGVTIERDKGEGRNVIVRGTPISWSPTLINGDRIPSADGFSGSRAVDLDIIPSELIEYVVVSKAITPDMEGDAIGGSINFITRSTPSEQTLIASVAGGYNGQTRNPAYNASLIYGNRLFNDKFGFLITGAIWDRKWGADNYGFDFNFAQPFPSSFSINNQQLRDFEGSRTTVGLNLIMDYKINEKNTLIFGGLYDVFRDHEFIRQHNWTFPAGDSTGFGTADLTVRNADYETTLWGVNLGGEHQLNNRLSFDWKYSIYTSELMWGKNPDLDEDQRGLQFAVFNQPIMFGEVSADGFKYWEFDAPDGIGGSGEAFQPRPSQDFDPNQLFLSYLGIFKLSSKEQDHVGRFNFNWQPNRNSTYKFGGKLRNKDRESITGVTTFIPLGFYDPRVPLEFYSDFENEFYDTKGGFLQELGTPYEDLLLDSTMTEKALDDAIVGAYGDDGSKYIPYNDEIGDQLQTLKASEKVFAAYVMGDWKLSPKIGITGGVRFEYTDITMDGFLSQEDPDGQPIVSPISESNNYLSTLPMVHITYSIAPDFNLRAAYTRTLARPNFNELNPSTLILDIGNGLTQIRKGNSQLKPTFSNNFDVMGELYFKDVGIFSGGMFYKDLSNLIFTNRRQEQSAGELIEIYEPANIEDAWLFGIELAFSKRLTFLPGFLSGFGIEANYTYTTSEVNVPTIDENTGEEGIDKQTLINQPEHIYNLALYYEKYGFLFRIAANYKDDYIDEYRIEAGPTHFRYYDSNLTLDLNAGYSISKKFTVFVEINNLTNEPLRYYHGESKRLEQIEYYAIRGQGGIRFRL